jgi:hypothetical protein
MLVCSSSIFSAAINLLIMSGYHYSPQCRRTTGAKGLSRFDPDNAIRIMIFQGCRCSNAHRGALNGSEAFPYAASTALGGPCRISQRLVEAALPPSVMRLAPRVSLYWLAPHNLLQYHALHIPTTKTPCLLFSSQSLVSWTCIGMTYLSSPMEFHRSLRIRMLECGCGRDLDDTARTDSARRFGSCMAPFNRHRTTKSYLRKAFERVDSSASRRIIVGFWSSTWQDAEHQDFEQSMR